MTEKLRAAQQAPCPKSPAGILLREHDLVRARQKEMGLLRPANGRRKKFGGH